MTRMICKVAIGVREMEFIYCGLLFSLNPLLGAKTLFRI